MQTTLKNGAPGGWAASGALVMGADYRALGVVRSLGRHRIPVWLVKRGGHLVAATSRYVRRRVPWPSGDDSGMIDYLVGIAVTHKLDGWLLFPTDDYAVALVARYYETLACHYRSTVPRWEDVRWACDKRLLYDAVEKVRLVQPWTAFPTNRDDLESLECPFPVIIKPALRLRPSTHRTPKSWPASDRRSLLARYDEASAVVPAEHLMVQEVVPGDGDSQFSYAALCKDGESLASLVARRTRQFPSDFGQLSTYVETVDQPRVVEAATRLLATMRFTGLVEVEFKRDPRDGQFKVLDVNPRVWGWHTLARRVGIDFPLFAWLLFNGAPVPERRGRAGERWMHFSADLRLAVSEVLAGSFSLRAYIRSLSGPRESAIFAWDDPLPGLLDLPLFACTAGRRLLLSRRLSPTKRLTA
ncbi:MAG: ATP-grasp domain-containing protein [Acidobacteria bacterium]|nr:MAG: ATP-grasp domain-containing protein [Acidobacteriota bacterium]